MDKEGEVVIGFPHQFARAAAWTGTGSHFPFWGTHREEAEGCPARLQQAQTIDAGFGADAILPARHRGAAAYRCKAPKPDRAKNKRQPKLP